MHIQRRGLCAWWVLLALVVPVWAQPLMPAAEDAGREPTPTVPSVRGAVSTGTGFFVSEHGHLVTTHHVVAERDRVLVRLGTPPRVLPAKVIKRDPQADLVLLKVDAPSKPLRIARWDTVPIGLEAYVLGFPLPSVQGRSIKITEGLINGEATQMRHRRLLQISAPVQIGNSGGPVVGPDGLVIGVVQSKLDALRVAEKNKDLPQNVNFAMSTSVLIAFLEDSEVAVRVEPSQLNMFLRPHQLLEKLQESVVMVLAQSSPLISSGSQ